MKFLLIFILILPLSALSTDIKMVTWNVFMIPKPINFSKQKLRTLIIAEKLKSSDYDIIFLQEAFRSKFQKEISKKLKLSHPYQENLKKGKNLFHIINSGLYIASKFPIKVLGKRYFDSCVHSDCFASKGVLLIELNLPEGKKLQMATTHLQAWPDKEAVHARENQLETINNLLNEHSTLDVPQFLIGDLNIDGNLPHEFQKALRLLKMTATPLSGDLQSTNGFKVECYKTPGGDDKKEWLDHIWVKHNNSKVTVNEAKVVPMNGIFSDKRECPLSDHHAVEAKISI